MGQPKKSWAKKILDFKSDGFANIFSGRGTSKDRNTSTIFQGNVIITDRGNLNLYNGSGMGKRIVDRWASDATREWITINNDDDAEILGIMDLLDAQKHFKRALAWALATGGGVIFMGIKDGAEDPLEPLKENTIERIEFLKVYNKSQITKDTTDIDSDKTSPNFGNQEIYNIHPGSGHDSTSFKVHHSRILEFEGVITDDQTWNANGNFHLSMFQTLFERLDGLDAGYKSAQKTLETHTIDVLEMQGLFEHAQGGTEEQATNRLNVLDMSKSQDNTIAVDVEAGEKMMRLTTTLAGFAELITKLENGNASVAGIPSTILYGQSSKGLNVSNDNEVRLYYDDVKTMQSEKLLKNIWRFCTLIQLSKDGPTNGVVDPDKTVSFNPLWQESAEEKAKNYKTTAEGDAIYIGLGAPVEPFVKTRFDKQADVTIEESEIAELPPFDDGDEEI